MIRQEACILSDFLTFISDLIARRVLSSRLPVMNAHVVDQGLIRLGMGCGLITVLRFGTCDESQGLIDGGF